MKGSFLGLSTSLNKSRVLLEGKKEGARSLLLAGSPRVAAQDTSLSIYLLATGNLTGCKALCISDSHLVHMTFSF